MTTGETSRKQAGRRGTFGALVPGFLHTNLDGTLVSIALPAMEATFGLSIGWVAWVPLAWLLATGALSPLAGLLADRVGRRRVYLAGLLLVAVGSAWSASSPTAFLLVLGRLIQGTGASAIVANGLAIIAERFEKTERAGVVGRMTALVAGGSILAPVAAGAMIQYLDWRSIFWLEAAGALAGAALVRNQLPRGRPVRAGGRPAWPWGTAGALVAASTAGLLALWGVGTWGLGSPRTLTAFGVAALLGSYVGYRNRSPETRLIEGRHIPHRIAWCLVSLGAGSGVLAGLVFTVPLVLAHTAGIHGLRLGLQVLPFPLGLVLGSLAGGKVGGRWGPGWPVLAGLVITAAGLVTYDPLGRVPALVALAVSGVGLGAFSVGANTTIIQAAGAGISTLTGLAGLVRRAGQLGGVAVSTVVLQIEGPSAGVAWLSAGVVVALAAGAVAFREGGGPRGSGIHPAQGADARED